MQIQIKNLGPIKDATLDLSKKLTVFCGPNNSGKTYAAFVIYALTKSQFRYDRTVINKELTKRLVQNSTATFDISINDVWKYKTREFDDIKDNIDSIFGVSSEITKTLFTSFDIHALQSRDDFEREIFALNFRTSFVANDLEISLYKNAGTFEIEISLENKTLEENEVEFLDLFLVNKIYTLLALRPFTQSYILPVERNSIYTFSKELSLRRQEFLDTAKELNSKSSRNSNPFEWLIKRTTRYPMPIRDGLEIAEDLSFFKNQKSEFYEFGEEIEQNLLFGKVAVSKDGDVLFTSEKAKTKKIPIHLSASIVKTLSSLVFYLKHLANPNDLIIIDEPELNLHPNNQVLLARFFAKLINKGFRLLISTHSDYIIRELNNLMMLASDKNEISSIRDKYGYSEDEFIKHTDVSAFLFNYKSQNAKYVNINKIKISENGFDVVTIDETISKINEVSEELYYTIKYSVEE